MSMYACLCASVWVCVYFSPTSGRLSCTNSAYLTMYCVGIPSNWVGMSIKMAATGIVFALYVCLCTRVRTCKVMKHI